jgi:hypothetical protein
MRIFTKVISIATKFCLGLMLSAVLLIPFSSASAATVKKTDFAGQVTSKITALTLKPSESITYKVTVKNTGKATWSRTGKNFVSIYTYFPKYRTSVFADKSWYKKDEPALMKEKTVKPGGSATFEFKLTAPAKAGTYEEGFYVAAENFTWIAGTQIKIPITVASSVVVTPPIKPAIPVVVNDQRPTTNDQKPVVIDNPPGPLAASLLIKSFQDRVTVAGGASAKVSVGFKNIGSVVWQTRILRVRDVKMAVATSTAASLADTTWPNSLEPSRVREPISPGNVGFFDFNILGPVSRGDYTLSLKLVVDDKDVPGATIDIPVTVTEDAPQLPTQEIPITVGAGEPLIRVGLWKVPGDVVLLNSSAFTVVAPGGTTVASVPAGIAITARYDRQSRMVTVNTPNGQFASALPVRFVPSDPSGLFQVPNFGGWDATAYVNRFRGTMEINYYQPNDNVWLIEELPLEQYLRGLAETSNDSNHEFQKTLIVAARNYAYFVHSIGGKYALFDVTPTAADQVYRAYGSETIRPTLVKAVEETRGQVVTYNNDIVVTPYFSRSDGRTRAWEEVWCCKVKPWLKSVPAPHDVGKTLWGHGVGMSASDALGWANDGKTFDWILKYFYTDTTLKKIY